KTDLNIINSAHGTVTDILLSPDEPDIIGMDPVIKLCQLPVCMLVKLDQMHATALQDLKECIIPVELTSKLF
ncbi:hypothetical protein V8B97DRAFT_1877175, partial [Scleroderma yunnanense]